MARIIVFGNEKGGSGKTTTAMHVAVVLLKLGFRVASIDLDSYQQSLSRYIENRGISAKRGNISLPMPEHFKFVDNLSQKRDQEYAQLDVSISEDQQEGTFADLLKQLSDYNFIIIDTPGSSTHINRVAHSYADIVVTPLNDSFLDVDLLGMISPDKLEMVTPGAYSAMFFEQKLKRAARDKGMIDWVVVRNRLAALDAINKRNMDTAIQKLSKRLGFRPAPGFGDRVIFKELFLSGLTLYDITSSNQIKVTLSVITARQEMRNFMKTLEIPEVAELLQDRKRSE